jgi:hypothetical protein
MMPLAYRLHEQAIEEYALAYKWYEDQVKGLGERFIDTVDWHISRICENPELNSFVHRQYRQVGVEGFPYVIVYKYFPKRELVYIAAIYHTSRNPKRKFRRED